MFVLLGSIPVCWFSRWREFRADAGGARLAGRDHMISALRALKAIHEAGADQAGPQQPAIQALKISGKTAGIMGLLFADHPPLDERIARLENPTGAMRAFLILLLIFFRDGRDRDGRDKIRIRIKL